MGIRTWRVGYVFGVLLPPLPGGRRLVFACESRKEKVMANQDGLHDGRQELNYRC